VNSLPFSRQLLTNNEQVTSVPALLMRPITLLAVVVGTFLATRFIDRLSQPAPRVAVADTATSERVHQIVAVAEGPSAGATAPAFTAPAEMQPGASRGATPGYFAVIGLPVGIDQRNRDRRALLRELWYPEYRNLGVTIRAEFIIGLQTYQGDGHSEDVVQVGGPQSWSLTKNRGCPSVRRCALCSLVSNARIQNSRPLRSSIPPSLTRPPTLRCAMGGLVSRDALPRKKKCIADFPSPSSAAPRHRRLE